MEKNKIICKKGKFIDEVFGDEIEYVRIDENRHITIIFSCDNTLVVKHFKNTRELIIGSSQSIKPKLLSYTRP